MSKRERDKQTRESLVAFWSKQPTDRLINFYKATGVSRAMYVIGAILEERGLDINCLPDQVPELETIIQNIREGKSFHIEDLYISADDDGTLVFSGYTQYRNYESITKAVALQELDEIKQQVAVFCKLSKTIEQLVNTRSIKYILYYDDSGKCSFPICHETAGVITCHIARR